MFNLDSSGEPTIRKASAHGLGHLLPPYDDESKLGERKSGVRLWQEDFWKVIIKSLRSSNPLEVRLDWREELNRPSVSQYSAATPDRLDWFKDYNKDKPYARQVKPFNFLLEFYAKRPDEMVRDGLLLSSAKLSEQPKPIAPYSRDPYAMLPKIRDRVSGEAVEQKWLRTYAETLRGYHRHPETKFLQGEATDGGPTRRRHIFVEGIEDIGKEADKWDEEEPLSAEDEFTVSYGISAADREQMMRAIQSVPKRQLVRAAHVSIRTIPSSLDAANEMPNAKFRGLFAEASALAKEKRKTASTDEMLLRWLVQQIGERGPKGVAQLLNYDAANLAKVIARKRKISRELRKKIGEKIAVEEGNNST